MYVPGWLVGSKKSFVSEVNTQRFDYFYLLFILANCMYDENWDTDTEEDSLNEDLKQLKTPNGAFFEQDFLVAAVHTNY